MLKKFNLYEFIGLIIGDGYIFYNKKQGVYFIEISGNAEDGKDYFIKVSKFLKNETGRNPIIKIKKQKRGRCLRQMVACIFQKEKENLSSWVGNKKFKPSNNCANNKYLGKTRLQSKYPKMW